MTLNIDESLAERKGEERHTKADCALVVWWVSTPKRSPLWWYAPRRARFGGMVGKQGGPALVYHQGALPPKRPD